MTDAAGPPPAAPSARICLVLHGHATLAVAGGEPARLERKQAALLAYLHLAGRTPRGRLAGLLWPEASASGARANLRQCLARLRRIAPSVLVDAADAVALAPAVAVQAPADGTVDLLEAHDYADCDDFARWLRGRVEAERSARQAALTTACRAAIARDDFAAAQAHADALLALDPESEDAHRAQIEVALSRGDFAAAVRAWERCRHVLQQAYGVAPSKATEALAAAALAGAPAASAVVARSRPGPLGNIAPSLPPLYGRAAELASLLSILRGHRLVTLLGVGGVGKTSLALAAAHGERERWRDGVWFVDMAAVREPAAVPGAIARTLGVSLSPQNDPADDLLAALRDAAMLLVLDNAEHLCEAVAGLAAALVAGTTRLHLLVTSRQPLRVAHEQRFPLAGLATPAATGSADPQACGALALFAARVAALDPRFRLTPANAPAVAEVCRRLDGLPLAIELAAARVPVLGVDGLRARLQLSLRVLGSGATVGAPRQQTLRATFDWTHALLTPSEQALLRRLAVFVGGFSLALAEDVAGDGADVSGAGTAEPPDATRLLNDLGALIDQSLVAALDADPPRYRLLEVTRDYALEKLEAAGEAQRFAARHAHATLRLFAAAEFDLNEKTRGALSRGQFLQRLAPELDNLRAARRWSQDAAPDAALAIGLAAVSTEALRLLGLSTEALDAMQPLRARVDEHVPAASAELFWTGLVALGTHGRLPKAEMLELIERAERLYRRIGSARRIHVGLYRKGFALQHLGSPVDAQRVVDEMAALEAADWPARAVALRLNLQGAVEAALARFDASIAAFRAAAALLAGEPGDGDVVLNLLANLCMSLLGAQRHEEALAVAAEVLAGAPSPVVRNIAQRAAMVASTLLGRFDEAGAIARQAMAGWRSDGLLPHMLSVFAWLAYCQGRVADALRLDGAARAQVDRMGLSNTPVFARARTQLELALAEQAVAPEDAARWRRDGEGLAQDEVVRLCLGEPPGPAMAA